MSHGKIECGAVARFSEREFIATLNQWRANPFGSEYMPVPASCVKRVYPKVVWKSGKSLSWPLQWIETKQSKEG